MMLVINPDVCIDCGICEAECPIEAIKPEGPDVIDWLERGREYSKLWPVISNSKKPMENAEDYRYEDNKFEKYMK
jgi:ferredoxin